MSLQVEKLENNTAKLTIEVPAEELRLFRKLTRRTRTNLMFLDSEKVKFLML